MIYTSVDNDDLFYAAGFIDGEGTFFSYGKYQKLKVSVANTYEPVISWFYEKFGGLRGKRQDNRSPLNRDTYYWQLNDLAAVEFCKWIAPYLKEKTEQALLVIAIQQLKNRGRIKPEIAVERARLALLLKEAKGRVRI